MLRMKALSIIVRTAHEQGIDRAIFQNLQENGLGNIRPLDSYSVTLTSAMGLGGGYSTVPTTSRALSSGESPGRTSSVLYVLRIMALV